MTTHALAGIETEAGIVFRHFPYDGYPEGLGMELLAYKSQAHQIVWGDATRRCDVEESCSDSHVALPDTSPLTFSDRQEFMEYGKGWVNYLYLWDGEHWLVADMVDDPVFRILSIPHPAF